MSEIASNHPPFASGVRFPTGWHAVRLAIGVLLVAAAFLKASSPWDSLVLESAYNVPGWIAPIAIQAEVALGVALLFNVCPRHMRWVALAAFAMFAAFSAYRAISGAESCGCFGPVKVNPWWTLALDIAALGMLVTCRPAPGSHSSRNAPFALGGYAVAGGLCFALAALISPSEALANPLLKDVGGITLLEPEGWTGHPFPLGELIEPAQQLSTGECVVLLYHHDCPKCQAAKPKYEALAKQNALANSPSVLLVELPPYGPTHGADGDNQARLTDDREWFVQAPVEISLRDGVVVDVSLDLPSIQHAHP